MNFAKALGNLSTGRALMLGFGLAAIYYFIAFDSGLLLSQSIAKHTEELQTIKNELGLAKQKIEKARIFEKTSAELGATLHSVLAYVPENNNQSDLMKIVSNEVKASGERLIKMRGMDEASESTFYQTVSVEVELQGSFVQHMLFLSYLTRVDQILTVDRLLIESLGEFMDAESPLSTMRVTIRGYKYLNKKVEPDAAS